MCERECVCVCLCLSHIKSHLFVSISIEYTRCGLTKAHHITQRCQNVHTNTKIYYITYSINTKLFKLSPLSVTHSRPLLPSLSFFGFLLRYLLLSIVCTHVFVYIFVCLFVCWSCNFRMWITFSCENSFPFLQLLFLLILIVFSIFLFANTKQKSLFPLSTCENISVGKNVEMRKLKMETHSH